MLQMAPTRRGDGRSDMYKMSIFSMKITRYIEIRELIPTRNNNDVSFPFAVDSKCGVYDSMNFAAKDMKYVNNSTHFGGFSRKRLELDNFRR